LQHNSHHALALTFIRFFPFSEVAAFILFLLDFSIIYRWRFK